jgi:RNA polymerase sigma-70 factor (ECF subfamily)
VSACGVCFRACGAHGRTRPETAAEEVELTKHRVARMNGSRSRSEQHEDSVTEERLIERAKGGSREAFGVLVEQHQNRLYRAACCLTRGASDAEDLAQEAFVRAYLALGRFRGDSAFYTWLFGILLNVYRRWVRKQQRARRRRHDAEVAGVADPAAAPSRRAAAGDELGRALRAIDGLPPRFREVMVLRHLEEMSYEEIAVATGCRLGTVRSRLHRARELLVARLGRNRGGAREGPVPAESA